jgi:hypothetical protein
LRIRPVILTSAAALTAAALTAPVQAMPVMPTNAPVDRLIQNVQAYLKTHPEDASAYFTLGRIQYFAFALGSDQVPTLRGMQGLPRVYSFTPGKANKGYGRKDPSAKPLTAEAKNAYIKSALANIQKAIALRDKQKKDEGKGLYELCLACVYEEGNKVVAPDWQEKAIANYLSAFQTTAPSDSKQPTKPLFGLSTMVSYEAGNSYVRLVTARGIKTAEKTTVSDVQKGLKNLEALPPSRVVTPIVFSLKPGRTLTSLLQSEKAVSFNLDGTGKAQRYTTWTRPDTALLVWDPMGTGNITSGKQLFGGVTWWLFWESGYHALNALDDNRNGWLEGNELRGLALWFDRNGNGKSDKGEVVSITQTPIAAIATQATGKSGAAPMNGRGLRLRDGRLLPTWDWVTNPLPPEGRAEQR